MTGLELVKQVEGGLVALKEQDSASIDVKSAIVFGDKYLAVLKVAFEDRKHETNELVLQVDPAYAIDTPVEGEGNEIAIDPIEPEGGGVILG